MDYEKEYGRYKKKVEDQEKVIREMQEKVEGWKQLLQINNATIAAILEVTGSVTVKQERVKHMVENEVPVHAGVDADAREITLGLEKPDADA